jgi:hypothetical protein
MHNFRIPVLEMKTASLILIRRKQKSKFFVHNYLWLINSEPKKEQFLIHKLQRNGKRSGEIKWELINSNNIIDILRKLYTCKALLKDMEKK